MKDIFNPYIVLEKFQDAGIITMYNKDRNLEFKVNPGSPYDNAYREAFCLALTSNIPLWFKDKLLYDPSAKGEQ